MLFEIDNAAMMFTSNIEWEKKKIKLITIRKENNANEKLFLRSFWKSIFFSKQYKPTKIVIKLITLKEILKNDKGNIEALIIIYPITNGNNIILFMTLRKLIIFR